MKKLIMLVVAGLALSTWATNAEEAKAIYDKSCAKCHGADGAGQTKMGQKLGVKNYTDAKVQAAMKDGRWPRRSRKASRTRMASR